MDIHGLIATLLQAAITAAVPVLAAYAVKLLAAKTQHIKESIENDLAKKYITEASKAVSTAVGYVTQTYVDNIKGMEKFDKGKQAIAFKLALERTKSLLTAEAIDFIAMAYHDIDKYLESRIEAEVKARKSADLTV
jgi:hypothetical protein